MIWCISTKPGLLEKLTNTNHKQMKKKISLYSYMSIFKYLSLDNDGQSAMLFATTLSACRPHMIDIGVSYINAVENTLYVLENPFTRCFLRPMVPR